MKKAAFGVSILLALCVATVAQDSSYYKAIEKGAATPVQPNQFKQMEKDALKDCSHAENYERLATAFGGSTEKVWAVIYGEVFCDLSSDADRRNAIGSLVYQAYEKSLSSNGGKLSVNMTENAQAAPGQAPFRVSGRDCVPHGSRPAWDMQSESEKLVPLLKARPVDENAVLAQVDQVLNREREIKKAQISLLVRIKNLLTEGQQNKLMELRRKPS
jgi:hypothetical protein